MFINLGGSFDYVFTLEAISLNMQAMVPSKLIWVTACDII
jgi:hypothetical protein